MKIIMFIVCLKKQIKQNKNLKITLLLSDAVRFLVLRIFLPGLIEPSANNLSTIVAAHVDFAILFERDKIP